MIDWNRLLYFGVLLFFGIWAQEFPDAGHGNWTGNWTWQGQEEWPPMNNTESPRLFPNISATERRKATHTVKTNLNNGDTDCNLVHEDETLRVYQCNLNLPAAGVDAEDDICSEVSSTDGYGCNWFNDNVTLCRRWRDQYTQSITFCKSGKDTCSDLDSRYMICACSVYYSWSNEEYFTFCDCKGALTENYVDGCAFRYFGLLVTPTDARQCDTICSRRSVCRNCKTNTPVLSPGLATFCMCEKVGDLYGRREICPCQEEYHNDTACSDEFATGQCESYATTTVTSTRQQSSTHSGPGVAFTPDARGGPDFTTQTEIITLVINSTIPDNATKSPDGRGIKTTYPYQSTPSGAPDDTDKTTTSVYSQTTQPPSPTLTLHSTTMNDEDNTRSAGRSLLSDTATTGIIFGAIGLIVLLILILLIVVLCVSGNRGRRKESIGEITPRADEFTEWRNGQQIQTNVNGNMAVPQPSVSTIAVSGTANGNGSTDSGLYYKDYFQVEEQSGVHINSENLYYFKLDNTPNGSTTGLDRHVGGTTVEADVGRIRPSNLDAAKSESVPNDTVETKVEIAPSTPSNVCLDKDKTEIHKDDHIHITNDKDTNTESPYYFKINDKHTNQCTNQTRSEPKCLNDSNVEMKDNDASIATENCDKLHAVQSHILVTQESIEENPYYFKLADKSEDKHSVENDHKNKSSNDTDDYFQLHKSAEKEEKNHETSNEDDTHYPSDYQSLHFRKPQNKIADSEKNDDYFHLLKPGEIQEQSVDDDDDYLSLRKIKTKHEDIAVQDDHDYLKLEKPARDYKRQYSNNSDTSNNYFQLQRNISPDIGTDAAAVTDNDEPYTKLNKQSFKPIDEEHCENDYQLLRKRDDEEIVVEETDQS